jgi:CheY-like chemotaxis protein
MPRNLLVVDDSPTIWEAVRCALTGEDWVVTAVATRTEALEAIRRSLPDVVLCDVALGEEDGYQVCRALRAEAAGAALPVILMGGTVSENLASGAGAVAVFAKPFQSDELLDVLHTALEKAPMSPEEEPLPLELTSYPGLATAAPAAAPVPDEVEIIDLSEGEDLPDVEFLEDLEPLPAGLKAEALDLGSLGEARGAEASAAGRLGRQGLGSAGPVELDLLDLEVQPEPAHAPGATQPAAESSLLPELDLLSLEEPEVPEAPSMAPEPEDLLEDIDLEGWAEEDLSAAPEGTPGPQASAPHLEGRPGAPAPAGSFDFGLEDLEPLPEEGATATPGGFAPAVEGVARPEETKGPWEEALAALGEVEPERPVPAFSLEIQEPAAAGEGPEPAGQGAQVPLWVEEPKEPEEAWAPSEPRERAESLAWEEPSDARGSVAGREREALFLGEPAAVSPEPVEVLAELRGRDDEAETWGVEPADVAGGPWIEEPSLSLAEGRWEERAEERVEGEAWAELRPAPGAEAAWDRMALEPETVATRVAADAGEAVRRALLESLSPEKLTPLVAATVERVVWEVVPQLAERLIREAIAKLQGEPPQGA